MAESFGAVYARLRDAQKGRARGAPAYSIYVNRPLGRIFAAFAYRLGMTPNQVTAVSAVFTFAGILLLALVPPSIGVGVCIGLLLALGYAWDSSDGQVARLRGGGSLAGEWLDHFVDAVKISSLHAAILIGMFRFYEIESGWLLVPLGFGVVANVTFFAMILNDLLKAKRNAPSAVARAGSSPLRSLILLPTDYGFLCLVMATWGVSWIFLPLYTAIAVICALFLVAAAARWFREMRSLDGDAPPSGA